MTLSAPSRRFRWWHGAVILVAANAISFWPAGVLGDGAFSTGFQLPPFAPPDWLFAPVWLVLNVTSLMGLARVANLGPPGGRRREAVLIAEAIGWVLFASFTTLYFWLHSPALAAADTVAGLLAAVVSVVAAAELDRTAAGLILLRLVWLLLASAVAVSVALLNVDPFLSGGGA
jgi:tryptophan-rich sensory protein